MKNKLRYAIFAFLLFGASGFNSAQAVTADELLVEIQSIVTQVNQIFVQIGQAFAFLDGKTTSNEARIAALEAEPRVNVAATAPTVFDDINAGYNEGSIWVDMTQQQAYILLDSAPGTAVWKQITNSTIYDVGDLGPAGGTVFHVTNDGTHGLEAAPVDQGLAEWGCFGTPIAGADGIAIGTGAQNTAEILAGCSTPGIAASLADAYMLNGFNDWFLPSRSELDLLYQQRALVGNFPAGIYWGSTEFSDTSASTQSFVTGSQGLSNKDSGPWGVRAVRAF